MIREKNFEQLSEVLSAYLDGELTPEEMEQVEALLRDDEAARRLFGELRQTVQAVSGLPRKHAPASIVEEVQLRLERNELLDDLPVGPVRRSRSRVGWGGMLSMAAVLCVAVIAGMWALVDRSADMARDSDGILAQRSQESAPDADRFTAIEPRRGPADQRETLAMARRSAMQDDEPEASAAKDYHDDRDVRRARATRGRRAIAPLDVTAASQSPDVFTRDDQRNDIESAFTDGSVMRLQLLVSSESERVALLSQITERYAAYQTGETPPTYEAGETARLALRLPLTEVDGMLTVAGEKQGVSEMTLTAGPLTVHGRHRIGEVLSLALPPMYEDVAETPDEATADAVMTIPDAGADRHSADPWRELIRSLGIDPETLALLLRPTEVEAAVAAVPESHTDDAEVESAPHALRAQAAKAAEDSLVARRLRAAQQIEPETAAPPVVDPADAAAAAASVDVIIEITISEPAIQPGGKKPSYPTRVRMIKPTDTEQNRPTAR